MVERKFVAALASRSMVAGDNEDGIGKVAALAELVEKLAQTVVGENARRV